MSGGQISRSGVVTPVRVDPAGLVGPTRGQARGRRWRRTSDGFYVPAHVDGSATDQRIVEAVVCRAEGVAATGWAALAWQGTRWFSGRRGDGSPLPVPLALGDDVSLAGRDGVRLSHDWLFEDDIIWVDGLPITRPERSVTYEARRARSVEQATQVIDTALAGDRVDPESLRAYAGRLAGRPGVVRLTQALALADENVWSPMEVTLRFRWIEAGRPRPLCNVPLFDAAGRHLITPDLFDPHLGIAGEYDGAIHLEEGPRRRDLNREELLRDHRIELVTMMSVDLRDGHDFQRRLDAAYRRASARSPSGTWTLDQPDWWVDTSTVARRRALTEPERSIWLRRQAA